MIKRLRRKFILLSALSVFFVLAITMGAINISNYVKIENDASGLLTEIVSTGPKGQDEPGGRPGEGPADLRQEHYFVATYANGQLTDLDNRQMFILTRDECVNLANQVYNNELTGGKYSTFRFTKYLREDTTATIAFLDVKERTDSAQNFLILSLSISAGAYLVLIGLIVIASKIAFKSSEEAYTKQKRFITNASHELKTPLTVISTDLDLIEMDNGKSEWTESIRDQLTRLNEMTNQLVTLSRLEEEDNSKYPFEDFSVTEVGKNAADSFAPSFKKEDIKFAYNFSSNITMLGNKHLIDELIHIFLDNSLKYTGGENKSSYFVISENKGKIELRFSNTLDKDDEVDIKQIMDRFYRSPSNKKEGSGVGLSIAQEIVNLHKGKINVDKNNSTISFVVSF